MSDSGKQPVYVTKTVMPSLEEYNVYLEQIFESGYLTNSGQLIPALEHKLEDFLGVPTVVACANGTLALQLGLHAAGLAGREVITTPFSYVATVSALLWEGCEIVFADIDEESCCLDLKSVADKLTENTAGVLPVHVYGNACDVDAFAALGEAEHIQIFYDAAHAFGSKYKGKSLLSYGDLSACSMHATNIFHSAEGGFLITDDLEASDTFFRLTRCGHSYDSYMFPGINAKLSELHAAMGLCVLDKVEAAIAARKNVSAAYDAALFPASGIRRPKLREGLDWNYAYYPLIFDSEKACATALRKLNDEKIYPRRYFSPALNTLPYLRDKQSCPVAESISRRAICLPLYPDLDEQVIETVTRVIRQAL